MADVWGEAEVVLHTDGRALPGEVAAATQEAATVGGKEFEKGLKSRMRVAARESVKDFGRDFNAALARFFRSMPGFDALSRRLRMLRTDFTILGNYARSRFGDAIDDVRGRVQNFIQPMRELRQEIGENSRRATDELREGLSHLRISMDDVRDTFPGVTRAVTATRDGFRRAGNQVNLFTQRVKDMIPDFQPLRTLATDVRGAWDRLSDRFSLIRQTMDSSKQGALDLRVAMENLRIDTEKTNAAFDAHTETQRRFGQSLKDNEKHSKSFFGAWKSLPHGFRQFTVWTTAILSGFEQLSVLGSAAGGGILIAAGALVQFGIGVGATIAVFQDLNNELDTLPEGLRPAAAAFQDIGKAFGEMQDFIQMTALKDAAGAFQSLADTVRALIPAFGPLAEVIGNSIGKLAENLKPGTKAFEELDTLIRNSAPTFEKMLDTAGKLAGALIDAFSNPTMQKGIEGLVGWVEDLVDTFADFVDSDDFTKWIENTIEVMEDFGGLLEGVGDVLNNLVDDEAVERTQGFLNALTDALPGIQSMLSALGELDVFGILAEALQTVFTVLKPVFDLLEPIAAIIRDVLLVALNNAIIAWETLALVMLPARLLWEAMAAVFDAFVQWLLPVQEALIDVGGAIQDATDKIVQAMIPAFEDIADAIMEMLPSPEEFERFLREELIPAIDNFASWLIDEAVPALQDFADWIRDVAVPAAKEFWDFLNTYIGPMLEDVARNLGTAGRAFENFGNTIKLVIYSIKKPIDDAIGWFRLLFQGASAAQGASKTAASSASSGGGGMASGGILYGPRRILAGEAGHEAIVPLQRSLNQVDPSVRWLSAIAQGKDPHFGGGGVVGGGKSVTIEAGAVQINGDRDPARTSLAVVNRLAERIAG